MMTDAQIVFRLVLSAFLSSLIGLERQIHRRAAGLRTHILVSLGSTLIMLTSIYISDINKGINVDPSRIAAGVITGIGFLGAGTIIRYGEEVKGLTTAASLWVAAGIGLSVGCGFYSAALTTTALALLVLLLLGRVESKVLGKKI
jgi:putative Mg2+ transporter-C (MgtC) family protein